MNEYKFLLVSLMMIYAYCGILLYNTPEPPTTTIVPVNNNQNNLVPTRTVSSDIGTVLFYRNFFTLMYLSYSALLFSILQITQNHIKINF